MAIVYPHRLTFLDRGKCNVCGNQGQELVHTNTDRYFGWETCNDEKCNETIQSWYSETSISREELLKKYGDWVYIRRSPPNNKLESGWEIVSDAHQEEKDGSYWLCVKKRHLSKEIQLSDLETWNT